MHSRGQNQPPILTQMDPILGFRSTKSGPGAGGGATVGQAMRKMGRECLKACSPLSLTASSWQLDGFGS